MSEYRKDDKIYMEELRMLRETDKGVKKANDIACSLDFARAIDLNAFHIYCDDLDKKMHETKMDFGKDMLICPYHEKNELILVYLFNKDRLSMISVVDNVFMLLASQYTSIQDPLQKSSVSCCTIKYEIADAVNVRLRMMNGLDIKSVLHIDNPVYLKHTGLYQYMETVYAWNRYKTKENIKKIYQALRICYSGLDIFYKKEIDEIVLEKPSGIDYEKWRID